ncbi:hypothetical protein [Phenylobacterium soli]|uniref:Uncharacterized protein n=1 Tax=Phenylobacterium soli TaxID=2170551 RepID=A0A328AQB6_9CAUL|nr:hypothetical protein [Phenylobacterium soli]RAK55946.1 hypothetical protein DJ017_16230 [Phenylobacterium soli]
MSDSLPTSERSARYQLAFLTDEWEWEADLVAPGPDQARAAARQALLDLVRKEKPALACVTLLEGAVKVGVWDWVQEQAVWTPL